MLYHYFPLFLNMFKFCLITDGNFLSSKAYVIFCDSFVFSIFLSFIEHTFGKIKNLFFIRFLFKYKKIINNYDLCSISGISGRILQLL